MEILLGLDIGTTNCKALALGEDGRVVAQAAVPTPTHAPTLPGNGGAAEYDAEELWQTGARLLREVCAVLAGQHVAGIAIASMGEAGVLADDQGVPLAPVLTWHDARPRPWLSWWQERAPARDLYRITGLAPSHIYSAHKLLWYRDQLTEAFGHARIWLCLADWITFRLAGAESTSHSLASRTMLFDVGARQWSAELLEVAGIPRSLLPPAYPGGHLVGAVLPEAAGATGLSSGTPVAIGGHDHLCAALASGVISPGPVLDSCGTTEALLAACPAPALDEAAAASGVCCGCHAARGRYYLMEGASMGGAVVSWAARLLLGADGPEELERLVLEAVGAPPGSGGVWFLPYLGLGPPPERDPGARGAWLGLAMRHGRPEAARAVLEGLCYALRQTLDALAGLAGFPARELRAVGGGARDARVQALKADVLGMPVAVMKSLDATALGAALLAGLGVGLFADEENAAARVSRVAAGHEPDAGRHAFYETAYRDYRGLYPVLRQMLP